MLPEVPSPDDPHERHMRGVFLAVVTGSFLFLIPWLAYLSVTLPTHRRSATGATPGSVSTAR